MREVRFFHTDGVESTDDSASNHWAGTGTQSCPPFWVIRVIVEGPPDPRTGYVCDIKILDDFVRSHLASKLCAGSAWGSFDAAALVVKNTFGLLAGRMAELLRLISVQLRFSPFTFLTFEGGDNFMIMLTQSFEFSASHRLHCSDLSEEENSRLFGKCSNRNGHGHNYLLEVAVEVHPAQTSSNMRELDRIVRTEVIERFDHKNLNVECTEFANLNPTVENIAQVIFDRLAHGLQPLHLSNVRVWETAKTYAECRGGTSPKI